MKWIVSQPWSNKKIFTQGGSANGIACYLQAEDQPEWLKAQFVIFATGELYKSVFQGGAYRYSLMHGWLNGISEGDYEPNILANEAYNVFWEDTNNDDKWKLIKYPAIHTTGWYDIFLQQQLDAYDAYKFKSSAFFKDYNYLIVMPGGHCAGGEIELGDVLSVYLSDVLFTILDVVGKPLSISDDASFIYYYVLGPSGKNEIGNYWANATYWPTPNGSLSTIVPTQPSSPTNFIYDPNDPVPTIGGNNLLLPKCGPWDQSSLDNRSDIVSFTSLPFKEPMAITGHIFAELYVSSNCTDTDFTVKLLDVFPNGTTSMLIQDGILRMRWRENNTSPTMMTPGTIYSITVDIWSTSYIMNIGHSLRVSVSSSNYPRFSINFNNGNPLVNPGSPLVAENSIYHDQNSPSHIQIPVVPIPDPTPMTLLQKLAAREEDF